MHIMIRKLTRPELLLIFEDEHHIDGIELARELAKQTGGPLEKLRSESIDDALVVAIQYSDVVLID